MELIRSGGVNGSLDSKDKDFAKYGFGNYFMRQIKPELEILIQQEEPIALCVAAKQDKHHYDRRLLDIGFSIDDFTVLGREDEPNWSQYAAVLLLGGETTALYTWLKNTGFNIEALTHCSLLAGDSAGAYVLSAKTLIDYTADGTSFEIVDGFLPGVNQLIAGHVNNPHYHKPGLTKALGQWCATNNVSYLGLAENEIDVREI